MRENYLRPRTGGREFDYARLTKICVSLRQKENKWYVDIRKVLACDHSPDRIHTRRGIMLGVHQALPILNAAREMVLKFNKS